MILRTIPKAREVMIKTFFPAGRNIKIRKLNMGRKITKETRSFLVGLTGA